jgi:hypothetical protein
MSAKAGGFSSPPPEISETARAAYPPLEQPEKRARSIKNDKGINIIRFIAEAL